MNKLAASKKPSIDTKVKFQVGFLLQGEQKKLHFCVFLVKIKKKFFFTNCMKILIGDF
jgi:hypothetical protein